MIKISNTKIHGWEAAIRGMRNPMDSWNKSDSAFMGEPGYQSFIGDDDLMLMEKLVKAGADHSKFMRFITVTFDVYAPLYWWKEFSTYRMGLKPADPTDIEMLSRSTMHKIHSKKFTEGDFSTEHLNRKNTIIFNYVIEALNDSRDTYLKSKDKNDWWQMIQMLPNSYNQGRTLLVNYQVLRNIYKGRKNHKLDEWHVFSEWIESLPYSFLITEV